MYILFYLEVQIEQLKFRPEIWKLLVKIISVSTGCDWNTWPISEPNPSQRAHT